MPQWVISAAKELAMDSAHVPCIAAIIWKHWHQHNIELRRAGHLSNNKQTGATPRRLE
jgi:hypothetical protein